MKKLAMILAVAACAFALVGCSGGEAAYSASGSASVFSSFDYDGELNEFLSGGRADRTSLTSAEAAAGEYLCGRLEEISGLSVQKQNFTLEFLNSNDEKVDFNAFNVVASYNEGKEKRVVIGANYDNSYADNAKLGTSGTKSAAVADNASGVVTLISIASALAEQAPALDFTVDLVFFAADDVGFYGTEKYLTNYVSNLDDVLLAVNLKATVGKEMTVYSDAVKTVQCETFLSSSGGYDTTFKRASKTAPLLPVQLGSMNTFSDYGTYSGAGEYLTRSVPVVSLFGWETDRFEYFSPEHDDYASFKTAHPEFAVTAADTAALTYSVITDSRFLAASGSFTAGEGYGFFNGGYFAYLAYLGLIAAVCVALVIVVKRMEKNDSLKPPRRRIKVAVFGREYEDAEDGDILVEITDSVSEAIDPFSDDK